jgi:hypothetical protein
MYYVKQHRDGRAVQEAAKTAKEAAALGDAWAEHGAVKIETTDGTLYPLDQFKKTILGSVRFGDA